jgi:hypothetical protein
MMWATYKAITSEAFDGEGLSAFEAEFHSGVAAMVGAQMNIAALDHELFQKVTPLISEAIDLGGDTYVGLKAAVEDAKACADELGRCNERALSLIKRLPSELANLLRS